MKPNLKLKKRLWKCFLFEDGRKKINEHFQNLIKKQKQNLQPWSSPIFHFQFSLTVFPKSNLLNVLLQFVSQPAEYQKTGNIYLLSVLFYFIASNMVPIIIILITLVQIPICGFQPKYRFPTSLNRLKIKNWRRFLQNWFLPICNPDQKPFIYKLYTTLMYKASMYVVLP